MATAKKQTPVVVEGVGGTYELYTPLPRVKNPAKKATVKKTTKSPAKKTTVKKATSKTPTKKTPANKSAGRGTMFSVKSNGGKQKIVAQDVSKYRDLLIED